MGLPSYQNWPLFVLPLAIESLIGIAKANMKNVKNWNHHSKTKSKVPRDKALRWMATAIQGHREKMRRLRGGKEQME